MKTKYLTRRFSQLAACALFGFTFVTHAQTQSVYVNLRPFYETRAGIEVAMGASRPSGWSMNADRDPIGLIASTGDYNKASTQINGPIRVSGNGDYPDNNYQINLEIEYNPSWNKFKIRLASNRNLCLNYPDGGRQHYYWTLCNNSSSGQRFIITRDNRYKISQLSTSSQNAYYDGIKEDMKWLPFMAMPENSSGRYAMLHRLSEAGRPNADRWAAMMDQETAISIRPEPDSGKCLALAITNAGILQYFRNEESAKINILSGWTTPKPKFFSYGCDNVGTALIAEASFEHNRVLFPDIDKENYPQWMSDQTKKLGSLIDLHAISMPDFWDFSEVAVEKTNKYPDTRTIIPPSVLPLAFQAGASPPSGRPGVLSLTTESGFETGVATVAQYSIKYTKASTISTSIKNKYGATVGLEVGIPRSLATYTVSLSFRYDREEDNLNSYTEGQENTFLVNIPANSKLWMLETGLSNVSTTRRFRVLLKNGQFWYTEPYVGSATRATSTSGSNITICIKNLLTQAINAQNINGFMVSNGACQQSEPVGN